MCIFLAYVNQDFSFLPRCEYTHLYTHPPAYNQLPPPTHTHVQIHRARAVYVLRCVHILFTYIILHAY